MSFLRRFFIPLYRLGVILCYALSLVVAYAEIKLGVQISLLCRLSVPFCGFNVILRYASSPIIA